MNKIMQRMKGLKRAIVLAGLILAGLAPAWAQDLYVIHNGNNYLSHNATSGAVNTASTTTFDPATCFWTISGSYLRPVNSSGTVLGSLYLRPRSGYNTYSLNTSTSTYYADWNGLSDGGQPYYNRYLRLNGTTWQVANTNSNRGTLRLVTVTPVSTTSTNPTISGADWLTSIGNSTYTASGAAYREGGYTNYRFNSTDHFLNGNTAITPANATIGTYTWSLTDNAYATVNSTSGVVTVTSLPEYDITLTLTVTATVTGGTPAAPANATLTGTKQITIQGTKPSAPTITVNGTNVILATTAAGSTTIRYTLDGTDPTASTGTVYSGAIDLSGSTTSPVTIKAITVRSGNVSDVTEQSVTLALPEPTITINGETGTATISSVAGATIYYTTDGTCPCDSQTRQLYTKPIPVTEDMTLKIMSVSYQGEESEVNEYHYGIRQSEVQIDLAEGWNWASHDLAAPLAVSALGDACSLVLTQEGADFVAATQSMKIAAEKADRLTFQGAQYNPMLDDVVLLEGWNWLGYPLGEMLTLQDAFSYLDADEGDIIANLEEGFSVYTAGQWQGDVKTLRPGQGYMYKSQSRKAFVYNTVPTVNARAIYGKRAEAQQAPWQVNVHGNADMMCIIANLLDGDDVESNADWVVGAFVGDECRGIGRFIGDELFLPVRGKEGENISISVISLANDAGSDVKEHPAFVADAAGTVAEPLPLTLADPDAVNRISAAVTTDSQAFNLMGQRIRLSAAKHGIFIIGGKKVLRK